jgi:hypothetical protein
MLALMSGSARLATVCRLQKVVSDGCGVALRASAPSFPVLGQENKRLYLYCLCTLLVSWIPVHPVAPVIT